MLTSNKIVIKSPDTVSRIIEKEAVVILPSRGELKVLNEVGARIWELVDGNRTVADMVDSICMEYDVVHEQAEKDVLDFIQQMVDKEMFVVKD